MKKLSESTNEELLKSKNVLSAILIVTPVLLIIAFVITYFTGYGSIKVPSFIMIPNAVLCYIAVRRIDKELKSREMSH